jgi:hypothetical protein
MKREKNHIISSRFRPPRGADKTGGMKRGFLNLRTLYVRAVGEDCGQSYIGRHNKEVPRDQEEAYDRFYERVGYGIATACVVTGFVWGFREDTGTSAMFSLAGMTVGLVVGGVVIPASFAYPLVGGAVGAWAIAKGAAVARHWYQKRRKD